MEKIKEKPKRRKRIVAQRNPKDYTGKAFLLLFAGLLLPVIGLILCVYHLWEALRLQYRTGNMQGGLIWLIMVTMISAFAHSTLLVVFFGLNLTGVFRLIT